MGTLATIESTAPLVDYRLTDEVIEATRAKYAALEATTPKGYEEVRQALAVVRGTRVGVEKRRVELKADALDFGRRVDAEAKRLTALIESIETPLAQKKAAIDDEKARIQAEAEAVKVRALEAEVAANLARQEAERKAIRDAEEARIAADRAKLEAERAALAEERRIADAKAAEERAAVDAAQRVERERLEAERTKLAEERRAEEERQRAARKAEDDRLRAEREAIEAQRRSIEAEREKAERAEFERQAQIRAEREAAEKIEATRLATAEREARIAALLPDAKKLDAFAAEIRALQPPTVKSKQAKQTLAYAVQILESAAVSLTGIEKQVV